ncbi:peptide deformylase [Liquorilactobacillus vini]|nr:peptide deformylase [Liquorilactobacillus vini]
MTVSYLDQNFRRQQQTFSGLVAQTIQHEIDHCNGRLI